MEDGFGSRGDAGSDPKGCGSGGREGGEGIGDVGGVGREGRVEKLMAFGDVSDSDEVVGLCEVTRLDLGGFKDLQKNGRGREFKR